ncbi:MAG: integration host factor subunit alpha [Deltaproteobacteria bacterium]|nr:integration host factor subunit alpha [Deltaproteobacteria bacterium]
MTLTKTHIIDSIYNSTDLNRSQPTKAVETFLESIKTTLESGEDVLISGFGKFYVNEKKERKGRNPHTDEDLMLEQRRVVSFSCSPVLREKMNGGR